MPLKTAAKAKSRLQSEMQGCSQSAGFQARAGPVGRTLPALWTSPTMPLGCSSLQPPLLLAVPQRHQVLPTCCLKGLCP